MKMYKLQPNDWRGNPSQVIFDVTNNRWIPKDPANTDYQQYLKWVAEGNTPTAADAATVTADEPATGA